MNKVVLKFLFVFSLILPNLMHATFCDYIYNTACFVKNNPIKSIVGTCLLVNACKNGKQSIAFCGLKGVATVSKTLPKLCSNKILLTTAAIVGGVYTYKKFNKKNDSFLD